MKASRILKIANKDLNNGFTLLKQWPVYEWSLQWLKQVESRKTKPRFKTRQLIEGIVLYCDLGGVEPDGKLHNKIHNWVSMHKAKKSKRNAAKPETQKKEVLDALRDGTALMERVLAEARARCEEIKQKQFPSGGFCLDSASQKGKLSQGEFVITAEPKMRDSAEQVSAAAKRFAEQIASQAPLCSFPVVPQDEQLQSAEPRPFQAGDKVKVKGREGLLVLEANPDYLHRSDYPLMVELPHFNGTIVQEEFTETGHWLIKHQEEGLPPILELFEEEQQVSDNGKTANNEAVNHPHHYGGENNEYEAIKVIEAWGLDFCTGNAVKYISRAGKKDDIVQDLKKAKWYLERKIGQFETVGSPKAKAFVDQLTKGTNDATEWYCTPYFLPQNRQRIIAKFEDGETCYGIYTRNLFRLQMFDKKQDRHLGWYDFPSDIVARWKPLE